MTQHKKQGICTAEKNLAQQLAVLNVKKRTAIDNRSCTGMVIKTAALVAFFESSIKKNQMKIHLLVMEVNQFELREMSFTRSNE